MDIMKINKFVLNYLTMTFYIDIYNSSIDFRKMLQIAFKNQEFRYK